MIAGMILTGEIIAGVVAAYLLVIALAEACWKGPAWLIVAIIYGSFFAVLIALGGLVGAALGL